MDKDDLEKLANDISQDVGKKLAGSKAKCEGANRGEYEDPVSPLKWQTVPKPDIDNDKCFGGWRTGAKEKAIMRASRCIPHILEVAQEHHHVCRAEGFVAGGTGCTTKAEQEAEAKKSWNPCEMTVKFGACRTSYTLAIAFQALKAKGKTNYYGTVCSIGMGYAKPMEGPHMKLRCFPESKKPCAPETLTQLVGPTSMKRFYTGQQVAERYLSGGP